MDAHPTYLSAYSMLENDKCFSAGHKQWDKIMYNGLSKFKNLISMLIIDASKA